MVNEKGAAEDVGKNAGTGAGINAGAGAGGGIGRGALTEVVVPKEKEAGNASVEEREIAVGLLKSNEISEDDCDDGKENVPPVATGA